MRDLNGDSHSCKDKGNLQNISLGHHEVQIQRAEPLPISSAISSPISDCSRDVRRGTIKKLIKEEAVVKNNRK
tara:strand:+ start:2157 stop:2375 length:219 start_codon:yes stop_codon:yes gene_type:complete